MNEDLVIYELPRLKKLTVHYGLSTLTLKDLPSLRVLTFEQQHLILKSGVLHQVLIVFSYGDYIIEGLQDLQF